MIVKLSELKLNELQLANLASEFYGTMLELTNEEDEREIIFDSEKGETAAELEKQFVQTLTNFKR